MLVKSSRIENPFLFFCYHVAKLAEYSELMKDSGIYFPCRSDFFFLGVSKIYVLHTKKSHRKRLKIHSNARVISFEWSELFIRMK